MTGSDDHRWLHEGTEPRRVKGDALPRSLLPRGLSRPQAATYIGVSPTKFDEMVTDGRMPGPKEIDSRRVWDRWALDEAFNALPDRSDVNPWD